MSARRRWLAALVVMPVLALSACGSTVAPGASGVRMSTADSLTAPALGSAAPGAVDGSATSAGRAPGSPSVTGSTSGAISGASRPISGSAAAGSSGGQLRAPGRTEVDTSRGVTRTTVSLGFQVTKNVQAAFAAVGASGSPANELQIVQALVKWVNDTGGISGRRLVPVIHQTDITNGSWASQAQAACADFTEDHRVFAVATSPVSDSDAMLGCLAQHQTPDIEQSGWEFDNSYYAKYPGLLYQPGKASPDRWARSYVDVLNRVGYFAGGAKIGLVRYDDPVYQHVADDVLKPELSRTGHHLAAEVAIGHPGSISDFGSMNAEIGNAILTLRSAGVDHVMFVASLEMPFFFMKQAESQGYRPIYGLSSSDDAEELQNNEPPQQLHGALIAGWAPPLDVGNESEPPGNKAWALCRNVMTKYGVSNQTGFYVQQPCDSMLFLRTVLDRMTTFTNTAFRKTVESLGTSYDSPMTFATRFGPGRYDGAASMRVARYQDVCSCFRYSGPTYPMP